MKLVIDRACAFSDNYIWLLHDLQSGRIAAVDPGQAAPVLEALVRNRWKLDWIINTHHHWDHTGANEAIKRATGCRVAGAAADRHRIPEIDLAFADGDTFRLGGAEPKVISTPGHTSGHICLWFEREQALLSGDTLFLMGCGKLTEGDAPTMWASLSRLAALPADTQIYCAHEYTLANARFARTVDPDNQALVARIAACEARLERGEATVR